MSNIFYKHIPAAVDAPAWEPIEFDTLEELVSHKHLAHWIDCFEDYTFEMSENPPFADNPRSWHLMIVTEGGYSWWVAGTVIKRLDLPEWKPKYRPVSFCHTNGEGLTVATHKKTPDLASGVFRCATLRRWSY